jgi:hypothetical protein
MSPFKPAPAPDATPAPRAEVIDLDAGPTTRIVLEADLSPFDRLDPEARRRLLVRVLCELVAYDEVTPAKSPMASV